MTEKPPKNVAMVIVNHRSTGAELDRQFFPDMQEAEAYAQSMRAAGHDANVIAFG